MLLSLLQVSRFTRLFRQLTDQVLLFLLHVTDWVGVLLLLLRCRHFEKNSLRLFKKCLFFAFIINTFSSRHRLHRLDQALYGATRLTIDHWILKAQLSVFNFQIYFESSVSFQYQNISALLLRRIFSKCRHKNKHKICNMKPWWHLPRIPWRKHSSYV